ncbi:N-6 DNA methylase [Mesorhizobium sp.]|uniref:N-6 DNA methylase n=1 Tax=Mesorhizobium sp. TaxID=1871066 RepID=UPI0025F52AD9|nr:N-6 DNA methylase [Mesorhizobium sp.]
MLKRAPDSQLFLGWEEKWDNLDFAHIPIGSPQPSTRAVPTQPCTTSSAREGGYYTPRPIADLMVRASFRALERHDHCHTARILDPAAGAGVFLLTAFRESLAANWRAARKRPDTRSLIARF